MAGLEHASVYEFAINLYDELEEKDGGYFPSKHDKIVLETTSNKYNISIEETTKIFNSFEDVAIKKQLKDINKLPPKQRVEKRKEMLMNILKNNKDLGLHEIEGPPTEPIQSGLVIINQEYRTIAEGIGKHGWTIPMSMGLSTLDKLNKKDIDTETYDMFFSDYYTSRVFQMMVKHVNASQIVASKIKLFNECVDSYQEGKYSLCVTALLTILEGILVNFADKKNKTKMLDVCKGNMDRTENEKKLIRHLIWISFYNFIDNLYKSSNFEGNEPDVINRHWILHGRTETEWKSQDCLRLFNAIYTLVTMMKFE